MENDPYLNNDLSAVGREISRVISWVYRNRGKNDEELKPFVSNHISDIKPFVLRISDCRIWEGSTLDSHSEICESFGLPGLEDVFSGFRVFTSDAAYLIFNNHYGITKEHIGHLKQQGYVLLDYRCQPIV